MAKQEHRNGLKHQWIQGNLTFAEYHTKLLPLYEK